MPSATLPNPEDKATIKKAIPSSNNKIVTATVARLYVAYPNPKEWNYTEKWGAIVLCRDHNRSNSFFFRLVDLKFGTGIIWEQELYEDFYYHKDTAFFHTFAIEDCLAGLAFCDEQEATVFYKKVLSRSSVKSKRVEKKDPNATTSKGFFSFNTSGKSKSRPRIDKSQISNPTEFRHIAHVGWDPEKGFDMKNVDPSWAELFSELGKYGIKAEDIKDPETAKFLVNYVKDRGGLKAKPEGVTEKPKPERRGAPPPPPPRKKHLQASAAAVSVQPPAISPTLPIRAPMPTRPVATSPALPGRAIPSPLPRSERAEDEQPITRIKPNVATVPPPPPPPMVSVDYTPSSPPQKTNAHIVASEPPAQVPPPPPPTAGRGRGRGRGAPPPPPPPATFGKIEASPIPRAVTPSGPPVSGGASLPAITPDRDALLASIRAAGGIGALRKVNADEQKSPEPPKRAPIKEEPAESSGTVDLAAGLAAALRERNKVLNTAESDEEEDDDWDDDE